MSYHLVGCPVTTPSLTRRCPSTAAVAAAGLPTTLSLSPSLLCRRRCLRCWHSCNCCCCCGCCFRLAGCSFALLALPMFAVAKQQQQNSSSATTTITTRAAAATTSTQRKQRSQRNRKQLQQEQAQQQTTTTTRAANAATTTTTQVTVLVLFVLHFVIVVVWVTSSCVTREYARSIRSRRLPSQPLPQSPCCLLTTTTTATVTFQAAAAAAAEKEICFGAFFFCAPPLHDLFYAHLWCLCLCLRSCLSCRRCCSLCCRRQQSCLIVFVLFNFCAANASSVCGFFPLWPHFCYLFLVYWNYLHLY